LFALPLAVGLTNLRTNNYSKPHNMLCSKTCILAVSRVTTQLDSSIGILLMMLFNSPLSAAPSHFSQAVRIAFASGAVFKATKA
jgi:hypothetical protein